MALEMGLVLFEVPSMGYPTGPPNRPRSRQTHSLRMGGARISWRPEVRAQWQPLTSGVHRCPPSLAQIHGLTGKVRPEAQVSRRGSPCMVGGCQARTRGGTCPAAHRPRSERWLCHPRLGDSAQ